MESLKLTTAKRRNARSTIGLRCVAVFYAYLALNILAGLFIVATATRETYPQSNLSWVLILGLCLSAFLVAVSIGLVRQKRLARWLAVLASLLYSPSLPVVSIVLIMYLTRPELDTRFV